MTDVTEDPPSPRWPAPAAAPPRKLPRYSFLSRFIPSISGCHPYVSEIIKPSMRNSPGLLELNVDL